MSTGVRGVEAPRPSVASQDADLPQVAQARSGRPSTLDLRFPDQCRNFQNPALALGTLRQITPQSQALERYCAPNRLGDNPHEFNIRMDQVAAQSVTDAERAIDEFYASLERADRSFERVDDESRRVWMAALMAFHNAAKATSERQAQPGASNGGRELMRQLGRELVRMGVDEFKIYAKRDGTFFVAPFTATGLHFDSAELVYGHTRRRGADAEAVNAQSGEPRIEVTVDALQITRRSVELGRVFKIASRLTSADNRVQAELTAEFCARKYSVGVGRRSSDACGPPAKLGAALTWTPTEGLTVQGEGSVALDIGKRRRDDETGEPLPRERPQVQLEIKLVKSFYIDPAGRPFQRR